MPPPSGTPGAGSGADTPPAGDGDALLAEADEKVTRAEARAAQAREHAARLRQKAEASPEAPKASSTRSSRLRLRRPRLPGRKSVAVGVGVILLCASFAASGYMVWRDHAIMHRRQLVPEFAAAAREGVTTLMSIDAQHAEEDVQHIIDLCTGTLKTQLEATSGMMVKQAEDSKVSSKVTVEAVAVESVSDNSGVVLVAAKSEVTDPDNARRPGLWRVSVNLNRDGGRLKMSKMEFVQ